MRYNDLTLNILGLSLLTARLTDHINWKLVGLPNFPDILTCSRKELDHVCIFTLPETSLINLL